MTTPSLYMRDRSPTFPFGLPSTPRPPRRPRGQASALVLGVYPSALHVRWTPPTWAQRRLGIGPIGALAVDDEPTVFWDGSDALSRVDAWIDRVGFRVGDGDDQWGRVIAAGNGTSGRSVEDRILVPLGLDPRDVWFTDIVDTFFVKSGSKPRQQVEATLAEYAPFAEALGLPQANLPLRPPIAQMLRLALRTQADRLRSEIEAASTPLIVTLGEEARRVLLEFGEAASGPPTGELKAARFAADPDAYGGVGEITLGGHTVKWRAMLHPGQRSAAWARIQNSWIERQA